MKSVAKINILKQSRKVIHITLCLMLCMVALKSEAESSDSAKAVVLAGLQNELKILQGARTNLEEAFRIKSLALDQQVKQIRVERENRTLLILGSALGVIVTVLGGWATVFQSLRLTLQAWIDRKLKRWVKDNTDELTLMLNRFARLRTFRSRKRIVVVCHTEARCQDMIQLLCERFLFKNVLAVVSRKVKSFPRRDLLIFDHEHYKSDQPDASLSLDVLKAYLSSEKSPMILYFGPQNRELSEYTSKLAFANNQVTLLNRMIEAFEYQEALKTQ